MVEGYRSRQAAESTPGVVELIGLENTIKLIERFSKQPLYVPFTSAFRVR